MKIMEILPQLNSGGAERFVVDLCNELSRRHDVYLVVLHSFDKYGFYLDEVSPDVTIINMNKKDGMDMKLFFRLNKTISSISPDIVHTHLSAIIYASFSSVVNRKIKFIHTVHNDAKKEAEVGISKLVRKFVFNTRLFVAVTISEESQISFENFYHLPSTLIYNGSFPYKCPFEHVINSIKQELQVLKTNKNAIAILNVARIQPQKNQVELARAIHVLNQRGVKIELFHIGSVADKKMENDIKDLNSPYIHLMGKRTNPRDYMFVADAFCLSSIFEGMPITLIECFSVGAIPICTQVGGIKDMIKDSNNGLLADGCTQQDLENVLLRFVKLDDKQKDEMRKKSKQSFNSFSINVSAERYLKLMCELVNN